MGLSCHRPRRQIRTLFVHGALAAQPLRRLWGHLRTCKPCRARYDRALRLQRVVATDGVQLPSPMELALLAPLVTTAGMARPRRRSALLSFRVLVPALSLCLVVLAATSVTLWRRHALEETWLSRSTGSATLAVRAFCETRAENGEPSIRSLSQDPGPRETIACPVTGTLHFATLSAEAGNLYVVRWHQGRSIWLVPEPLGGAPLLLPASNDLNAVPLRIGLDLVGSPPQVITSFVRTRTPVSTGQIEGWLEAWHAGASLDLPAGVAIVERRVPVGPNEERDEP